MEIYGEDFIVRFTGEIPQEIGREFYGGDSQGRFISKISQGSFTREIHEGISLWRFTTEI